jgi:hypothetical protein
MSYTIPESAVIDYPPELLNSFHLYAYEWIDNLQFIPPPKYFIADPTKYLSIARKRFIEGGWDGDGEIGLMWLPPFVFSLDPKIPWEGIIIWHVKQTDDGISWMLSPVRLPFKPFADPIPSVDP